MQNCFEDLLCYCEQCRSWSAGAVWRAGLCERTEVLVLTDRCQPVQSCVLSTQSHATPAIVVVVDSVDCLLRHTSIGAVAIVCGVLSRLPRSTIQPLQRVMNAAARVIMNLSLRDHVKLALKQLHWLPVERRITYKLCLFMHHIHTGQAPQSLAAEPIRQTRQ